jgi:hypothetical protein
MKTTKVNTPTTPHTEEEQKRQVMEAIFEQAMTLASDYLKPFDTEKYRTTVTLNHEKLETNDSLIREFLCFHFNLTLSKNKNGYHVLYFNFDEEAITKFGSRVFNQMVRTLITLSSREKTQLNIEERVRIATKATDVHNFLWKRVIDGDKEHIIISTVEPKMKTT